MAFPTLNDTANRLTDATYFGDYLLGINSAGLVRRDGSTPLTAPWAAGQAISASSFTGVLTDKGGQVYDAAAYGASPVASGAANTAAINAAFAAAGAGGTVMVPPGAYSIAAGILFTAAGQTLYGPGATLKVINGVTGWGGIVNTAGFDFPTIGPVTIDGNKSGIAGGTEWGILNTSNNATIRNCKLLNLTDIGIRSLGSVTNLTIENNIISGTSLAGQPNQNGISIGGSTSPHTGIKIGGNVITGSGNHAIFIDGTSSQVSVVKITKNLVYDNVVNGIYLAGLATQIKSVVVSENIVFNCQDGISFGQVSDFSVFGNVCTDSPIGDGLALDGCTDGTVAGNYLARNYGRGILVTQGAAVPSVRIAITGNACRANNVANIGCAGIDLVVASYCAIVGNVSTGSPQAYGIREAGPSDYNVYSGNICSGNVTAPYSVIGTHSGIVALPGIHEWADNAAAVAGDGAGVMYFTTVSGERILKLSY